VLYFAQTTYSEERPVARSPSPPSLSNLSWLDDLSLEQLTTLITAAQGKLQAKRDEALEQLRRELLEKAQLLGVGPSDLLGNRRGRKSVNPRSTVKPKYRDTRDPTQTWSGRGRAPRWLQERLKAGENKDDYLIR
jgi:DNA-binding protein H-NS